MVVNSKLDYCNAKLFAAWSFIVSHESIAVLCSECAVRIVYCARSRDLTTPLLERWLKMPERIQFRYRVLAHRCLRDLVHRSEAVFVPAQESSLIVPIPLGDRISMAACFQCRHHVVCSENVHGMFEIPYLTCWVLVENWKPSFSDLHLTAICLVDKRHSSR